MKYFIKDSDQEVKFGQTITVEQKVNTTLGEGICKTDVKVTSANIDMLVKQGFLVQKDEEKEKNRLTPDKEQYWNVLKPFIRRFARKNDMPLSTAVAVLVAIQEFSSRAQVDILLETIAEVKNRGKNLSSKGWFCNPMDSYRVAQIIGKAPCIIRFADRSDAEYAYQLIKPFIPEIANGQ